MKLIKYPKRDTWSKLLQRPTLDTKELSGTVSRILEDVRANGDAALRKYAREFDNIEIDKLRVTDAEFAEADAAISQELKEALNVARANIEKFHAVSNEPLNVIETTPGVFCWKRSLPIEKVGLYVPAGSAPLFSTVLMLAIPAQLAGCSEVVICSPTDAAGSVNEATLYVARLCGVTQVYKIGGAQAIAAMAYGTESVPSVYKIFGPGNQYVTESKLQILRSGVAIDMPAGPSEVAVLADETCVPTFVAADLLSQAEHGPDSQVVLVSTSENVIEQTLAEMQKQLETLPRNQTARTALGNSKAILVESLSVGMEWLNAYAPEHLIIATKNSELVAETVTNAGSVFIGNYSCESAGDYASGTNHTLPTNGAARAYSGVSVASFMKTITYQKLTADGIRNLGPMIEMFAAAEGLDAHRNAVAIRLNAEARSAEGRTKVSAF
jgi:histidinol dehydrogenase